MKRKINRVRGDCKNALRVDFGQGVGAVLFATKNPIAKRWFYPRYLTGALHEPQLTRLLITELNEHDVFFDVGANLGWFTLLGDRICTRGEVHSFEIDPTLTALMLDSLNLNPQLTPHFINNVAVVTTQQKLAKFNAIQTGNRSTNQAYRERYGAGIRVGGISLDDYCSVMQCAPSFIKIDIEGGEVGAIEGMKTLLKTERPKLVIELHPAQISEQGRSPQELVDFVCALVPTYDVSLLADYRNSREGQIAVIPEGFQWTERPVVAYFREPS